MGNILVVDDERSIRITAKAFLEADGHTVATAKDAESAMAALREKTMDVIMTDIIMPRLSGVELLRRVREISSDVQVIMMTGEPTLETASESLRLGAVDYLQKPVGKTEILKTVRNALRVKYLNDEKHRLEAENQNYMNHLEQLVEERTCALAASEAALRLRAEELSVLNLLARKVNESLTVADAVQSGLGEIVRAVESDFAAIFLLNGDALTLKGMFSGQSKIVWHLREVHSVGACLCGMAVRENKAVYSVDIGIDPRCSRIECLDAGFCSFAALPIRCGSEILGVLGIAALRQRDFQDRAVFLEALASEMAIGLNKSLLYEQVQQHALDLKASLSLIEEAEAERRVLLQNLQQSQKMEAIGTLASGIAHDFNNILGAVIGYTELALLNIQNENDSREKLSKVLTASERAKALIHQILAFSRQSEEERKPVQISHIVKEVLQFMRASLPATIEIRKDIDDNIETILADPVQIHQIFMNLCTNAHHAMKASGGVLDVRLVSVDIGPDCAAVHPGLKPGPHVRITVKDTGHGMDRATLTKIFDPYFTTKEKGLGTGLGLAVVHGIVQKHGGVISVTSEPGNGTAFDLYFPVIQEKAAAISKAPEDLPTGNEHILLIDDEQTLVDMGREMLEYLGYTVETRTSSVDALAHFRLNPARFDLVVTDLTMPNKTGDKLAEELLRMRPDIPVVICTGYCEEMMEERFKAVGIRALVMKPILLSKIAIAIREVLDKKPEQSLGVPPAMASSGTTAEGSNSC
jgi:signal transduction histidine kinase/DNA-binding response OmpR family regulator